MGNQGFGSESYEYTPDAPFRQRIVFARTIRPKDGVELNCDFERRMDELAEILVKQHGAYRVRTDMKRHDGAIVECLVTVEYEPRPEPVADDTRPAGGRTEPRGTRGGR